MPFWRLLWTPSGAFFNSFRGNAHPFTWVQLHLVKGSTHLHLQLDKGSPVGQLWSIFYKFNIDQFLQSPALKSFFSYFIIIIISLKKVKYLILPLAKQSLRQFHCLQMSHGFLFTAELKCKLMTLTT